MKTPLIILFTLICQSLCGQLQTWVWTGRYEMRVRESNAPPSARPLWWVRQILDSEKLSEVYLTCIPTCDYDRQMWISQWYGGKQWWIGSNVTTITWSNGIVTTNVLDWQGNGRWTSGGNCTSWSGIDAEGQAYDLQSFANMACWWNTNNSSWGWRCPGHADLSYTQGLYRTNGSSTLVALAETDVRPGQTNYLIAPSIDGKYDFRFMLAQNCLHCGEGCPTFWTPQICAHNGNAILLAENQGIQITLQCEGKEDRWTLESSEDMTHWMPYKSGPVPIHSRINGGTITVREELPAGLRFYRVRYSAATLDDTVKEMFETP